MAITREPLTQGPSALHGPRLSYPVSEFIDVLVADQASRDGARTALAWRSETMSYAELDRLGTRAARSLRARGVGPGDVVTVQLPRTPTLVATLLGVLRCGAAYAAVPHDWPERRHDQLRQRTGARLTVSDAPGRLAGPVVAPSELLDRDVAAEWSPPVRSSGAPFSVFLTSGTTGEPRAALVPHRGVARTALDLAQTMEQRPVSLQSAVVAWDVFALELWVTLIRGGTCHLYTGDHLSCADIRAAIAAGVTVLCLPPVLLSAVVESDLDCLDGLQTLFTGGDRPSAADLTRCLRRFPGLRIISCYGPVENTINTTTWEAGSGITAIDTAIPVGRPTVNTSVYIVDDGGAVLPWGQVGEIAVAGDGLALGYAGDSEYTASRFREIDAGDAPRRVYLSGDLGRIGSDGQLEFCGRRDRQLKVRGVRVEPEEVELAAERVAGVSRAVAVGTPIDAAVKTGITLLVRPSGTDPVPAAHVLDVIAACLPAAFVPNRILPVADLPELPNGKIDYAAAARLVPPDGSGTRTPHAAADDTPVTESGIAATLRAILEAITDILGGAVGADEDIFDNGATSLSAIRLANRIASVRLVGITPADVMRARTPRRIAELAETLPAAPAVPASGPSTAMADPASPGRRAPVPVQGFWAMTQRTPGNHETIVPLLFRLPGTASPKLLGDALDAVVARHDVLRSHYWMSSGDELLVRVLPAEQVRGVLADDTAAALPLDALDTEARRWLLAPFPLVGCIPIRARLMRAREGDLLLAIAINHIALDAWSAGLFCQDIARAYRLLSMGQTPFDDHAPSYYELYDAQRAMTEPLRQEAVRYWADLVDGTPWMCFPSGPYRDHVGPMGVIKVPIGEELLRRAAQAAGTCHGTVSALFLASYTRVLRELTGQDDLAVSVPVAGRLLPEAELTLGCFANMLSTRLPAGESAPARLVDAAATQLRRAVASPDIGLDDIYPQLPAHFPRHPLLQAFMLGYEPRLPAELDFGDVTARYIEIPLENWSFDIALEFTEGAGATLYYRLDAMSVAEGEQFAADWLADVILTSDALLGGSVTAGAHTSRKV
jgi:mycobactin peptide synthetase MbtE